MTPRSTLSNAQKIVLSDFYSAPNTKVAFNTAERKKIWNEFKKRRSVEEFTYLE
jgi:hypothetical protein